MSTLICMAHHLVSGCNSRCWPLSIKPFMDINRIIAGQFLSNCFCLSYKVWQGWQIPGPINKIVSFYGPCNAFFSNDNSALWHTFPPGPNSVAFGESFKYVSLPAWIFFLLYSCNCCHYTGVLYGGVLFRLFP